MCEKIFPEGSIIPSNRKLKNVGEIIKPTLPKRFTKNGPEEEPGYFPCEKCDLCKHAPENTKTFKSPWDDRKWKIRKHLTCLSRNIVYLVICTVHENCWYIGSTDNLRRRWSKHKHDWKNDVRTCTLATHGQDHPHPNDPELKFLKILPLDSIKNKKDLLQKEVWWQENVGVHKFGLNKRNDLATVSRRRKK